LLAVAGGWPTTAAAVAAVLLLWWWWPSTGSPTADFVTPPLPLGVKTLVSDREPVYSSLSQSSAAGKSSPQFPANKADIYTFTI